MILPKLEDVLVLRYQTKELIERHVMNGQDLNKGFDRDVRFSLLYSPVLNLWQIILCGKFLLRFIPFFHPEFREAVAENDQNFF